MCVRAFARLSVYSSRGIPSVGACPVVLLPACGRVCSLHKDKHTHTYTHIFTHTHTTSLSLSLSLSLSPARARTHRYSPPPPPPPRTVAVHGSVHASRCDTNSISPRLGLHNGRVLGRGICPEAGLAPNRDLEKSLILNQIEPEWVLRATGDNQ